MANTKTVVTLLVSNINSLVTVVLSKESSGLLQMLQRSTMSIWSGFKSHKQQNKRRKLQNNNRIVQRRQRVCVPTYL